MADPLIALDRVSVRYATAPSPTLRDISFRVEPGEFVGIVGSTGSGKSTLLYLLAGVIPHYLGAEISGDVLIHGRRTQELSLARISERVGLVLQDPEAQLFNLLVRDELAWGLENRGLPRAQIASRLASTLSCFRIEKLQDRITYDLSGGEKQRVALAAVHAIAPEVYLFDHPTSQLDPIGAAEVIAAVRRLAEHHEHAIVMVEDKVDELVEHAPDRSGGEARRPAHHARGDDGCAPRAPGPGPRGDDRRVTSSSPAKLAVLAEGLEFEYPAPRRILALKGVALRVPKGEFAAIVGQNGSGKTSLARCISGYLRPTRGTLRVADTEVWRLRPAQRATRVGYVFQNPDHQLFRERVWDDVAFGLQNLGASPDEIQESVEQVLRRLELWDKRELHPFQLSRGDRQRLAIAAIIVMRPQILIVDEPTTGQDMARSREIMDLLARLNHDQGMTILTITHVMELVAEYARWVIVMHDGRVLLDGPPRQVFSRVEELRISAISPPPVARLGLILGLDPLPITVPEARDAILR